MKMLFLLIIFLVEKQIVKINLIKIAGNIK